MKVDPRPMALSAVMSPFIARQLPADRQSEAHSLLPPRACVTVDLNEWLEDLREHLGGNASWEDRLLVAAR